MNVDCGQGHNKHRWSDKTQTAYCLHCGATRDWFERWTRRNHRMSAPAFGQNMRQPEGFNPPPLELRSPEPKQGQML